MNIVDESVRKTQNSFWLDRAFVIPRNPGSCCWEAMIAEPRFRQEISGCTDFENAAILPLGIQPSLSIQR